jgi:hypothetical protein
VPASNWKRRFRALTWVGSRQMFKLFGTLFGRHCQWLYPFNTTLLTTQQRGFSIFGVVGEILPLSFGSRFARNASKRWSTRNTSILFPRSFFRTFLASRSLSWKSIRHPDPQKVLNRRVGKNISIFTKRARIQPRHHHVPLEHGENIGYMT